MTTLKAIRGFNDVLPSESVKWQRIEQTLKEVLDSYGYSEIRLPLVEETELFARGVGEATDIVEKEMFCVSGGKAEDKQSFTLRPEGTAGCVRAVIEHNLLRGDTPKLWYMGAMFRYERPQKGRYRQFTQLGVESFGADTPDADAELIAMTAQFWQKLGIDGLTLELNSIGDTEDRLNFKTALVDYLTHHFDSLDSDSQRRLSTNPMRILDSKDVNTQAILQNAPKLGDYLSDDSHRHFKTLQKYLTMLGIDFVINEKLVRGLDYYNKTVFEWTTDKLGAQATVCGGGRYDGLIGTLKGGGQSAPAVGFAMGLERLVLLLDSQENANVCDVFVVGQPEVYGQAMCYANRLRQKTARKVKMASATSIKAQMKKADKSGAVFTVIVGESEVQAQTVTVKNMTTGEQMSLKDDDFSLFDEMTTRP